MNVRSDITRPPKPYVEFNLRNIMADVARVLAKS